MTNSPAAMNGSKYSDLEFEDKTFLRSVRRAQLCRIVDGRVQIRNPSDVGYTISYNEAVALAPLVVKQWWKV